MLSCPLKSSKGVDWSGPLRTYLKNNYSSEILDKHAASIQRLSTARERIANASSASEVSIEAIETYLVMLGQTEPRFPLGEGGLKISFVWFDSFKPTKKVSMNSIAFERAAVCFNLGALLSYQGMVQDRQDINGLKKACTFYQRSAGVFGYLRDEVVDKKVLAGPTGADLSREGLDMMYNLMLAQAQACFYEKAIKDKHKPAILSKLASQAAEWYQMALADARTTHLADVLDKMWGAHLEFQYACFFASSQFQYSKVVHDIAEETTKGYGEEIARLQLSASWVDKAIQVATSNKLPDGMLHAVQNLRAVIEDTLFKAIETNNKVYLEIVPAASFPPVAKAALAKPIAFSDEYTKISDISVEVIDEDALFAGLLPASLQEAEVMYASRVSKTVEDSAAEVAQAAEGTKLKLSEAGLPAAVEASESCPGMPEAVWERINSTFKQRGGQNFLRQIYQQSDAKSREIDQMLMQVEKTLDDEEVEDSRCRSTYGSRWAATPSGSLNTHMRGDIARYMKLLQEARASDGILMQKIDTASDQFRMLDYSREQLDSLFPTDTSNERNPEVEAMRGELAMMLVKLGSNIAKSESIQAEIVDFAAKDNIVQTLLKFPGGPDAVAKKENVLEGLIEKEIQTKYAPRRQMIQQLIGQQPGMLGQVLQKNQKFAQLKTQSEAMGTRERIVRDINDAIGQYEELLLYVNEGSKFYANLFERVRQLYQTAKDHVYVRNMQRSELEMTMTAQSEPTPPGAAFAYPMSPYATATANVTEAHPIPMVEGFVQTTATAVPMQPQAPPPYPSSYGQSVSPTYRQQAPPATPASYSQSAPQPPPYAQGAPPVPPKPTANRYGGGNAPPPYPAGQSTPPYPQQNTAPYPSGGGDSAKLAQMRDTLGNAFTDYQLRQALDNAGGNVNTAINHLLN